MHIGHMEAQALAASVLQEAAEARAQAKAGLTRRERLAIMGKLAAQNAENPEVAVKGTDQEDEEEADGDGRESSGGSLNARA